MRGDRLDQRVTIGILGASGRLGKAVAVEILQNPQISLGPLIVHKRSSHIGSDLGLLLGQAPLGILFSTAPAQQVDAWIDVSLPSGLQERLALFGEQMKPVVIGTTGFSEEDLEGIQDLSERVPLIYAPNFSLGMALMQRLAEEAARHFPLSTQIDLVETHHCQKQDAPSGSALLLAKAIQREVPGRLPVSIHSIRSGKILGQHALLFNTGEERLTLIHEIDSRDAFVKGALEAALFVLSQPPGLYGMQDLARALI